jgi:hypothetical protein
MHMVLIDYEGLDLYCQIDDDNTCEGAYTLVRFDRQRNKHIYKDVTDLFVPNVQDAIFAMAEQQHRDELADQEADLEPVWGDE